MPLNENQMNMLDLAADFAQFYSLFLLLKDATNGEIMRGLDHQNKDYLETIIKRLDNIEVKLEVISERLEHLGLPS